MKRIIARCLLAFAILSTSTLVLATPVMTPTGWLPSEEAAQVQVLRNNVQSFIPLSEMLATDRVKACKADVRIGSQDSCPESGRTSINDAWWRASEIFPATPPPVDPPEMGHARVTARFTLPLVFDDGSPIPAGLNARSRLYEGEALIVDVPWTPQLQVIRSFPLLETRCWRAALSVDLDSDAAQEPNEEGRGKELCSRSFPLPPAPLGPKGPPEPIVEALQPGERPPP